MPLIVRAVVMKVRLRMLSSHPHPEYSSMNDHSSLLIRNKLPSRCKKASNTASELSVSMRLCSLLFNTGCNKIIAPCTLYTKNGIFYFCNRSNHLIYMYVR